MFLQFLSTDPQYYVAVILVVIISICLHELAHGFTAIWLGDRTPIETGHITLNPLTHMGGMSLLFLFLAGISWGQMPVDPRRLRGRYGDAIVSAAGPAMNLLLALLAATALALWRRFGAMDTDNHMVGNGVLLLWTMARFNVALFLLNLVPVPPLDGSRILGDLVPSYRRMIYDPTMQGVMLAVMIGVLLSAGKWIFPAATEIVLGYIGLFAPVGR